MKHTAGYIINCRLVHRDGDPPMFTFMPNANVTIIKMNGYAIVPKEQYDRLVILANEQASDMLTETLAKPPGSVTPVKPPEKAHNWNLYAALVLWWAAGMVFGYIAWGPK